GRRGSASCAQRSCWAMARMAPESRCGAGAPWMQPAASRTARKNRRMRTPFAGGPSARQESSISDARRSPSATPLSRTAQGGRNSMLLAALLLAAPTEDLQARLRHLESVAAAWAPAPSPDTTRVAFLTTLFGARQAASVELDGSYPTQLTDEPEGVVEVRYLPSEAGKLVAVALRDGRRRLLFLEEEGATPAPVDPDPGDQFLGGFSRDGKKLFYAVQNGATVSLRTFAVDSKKTSELSPPPPAAGTQPAAGSLP